MNLSGTYAIFPPTQNEISGPVFTFPETKTTPTFLVKLKKLFWDKLSNFLF